MGVLLESARFYNFQGISRGAAVSGGSVAQSNCQNALPFSALCRLEYASSNQVVGGSTTRRRAGLDVAASAAAVRSEAEDEGP